MASCCEGKSCELTALSKSHGYVLWVVLVINAVMFFVEGLLVVVTVEVVLTN